MRITLVPLVLLLGACTFYFGDDDNPHPVAPDAHDWGSPDAVGSPWIDAGFYPDAESWQPDADWTSPDAAPLPDGMECCNPDAPLGGTPDAECGGGTPDADPYTPDAVGSPWIDAAGGECCDAMP